MEKFGISLAELAELQERERRAILGGGLERIEKEHSKGKLTARERLDLLLDKESFIELYMLAEHQCRDFDMDKRIYPGDGVACGWGTIEGRRVAVYAQDATVLGGAAGVTGGRKIIETIRMARLNGTPCISLIDSAGARIQEGMENVRGYAEIFYENALTSGIVPQISAIMGNCAGGAAYSPALTDYIFQVAQHGRMFLTGPNVIREITGEEVDLEQLGGVKVHGEISGVVHFVCRNEEECIQEIKQLLHYLPSSNRHSPPMCPCDDDPNRLCDRLLDLVPSNPSKSYDMVDVIHEIVDKGEFLEVHRRWARNILIGFAHFDGISCGIVANQPKVMAGTIDINASDKAARFIRFCDAFNIPIVTLADVPGYMPGIQQEYGGIIRHGAKMLFAYTEATVPKITVVLRKYYGGSIAAMCPLQLGADRMIAWPTARLAILGARPAVEILYGKEIRSSLDPEAERQRREEEYERAFSKPYYASAKMLVDSVIDPRDTRRQIVESLHLLAEKAVPERGWRKHGNIPL